MWYIRCVPLVQMPMIMEPALMFVDMRKTIRSMVTIDTWCMAIDGDKISLLLASAAASASQ